MPKVSVRARALAAGYRSGLEETVASQLNNAGIDAKYEERKLKYVKPATNCTYTPDFVLPNGIVIETKGRFMADDRKKHVLLKQQHPDLDVRFVFNRSKTPISKGSKTTYAIWCEKSGFAYADVRVPQAWIDEPPQEARLTALSQATK